MATYNEVLIQVKSLTRDEQLRLLEELAGLIRQRVISQNQDANLSNSLRRQKIVEILEKIAATNVFANISDPVEWQRELRQDPKLL
ncbi:hypothetical protein [Microseira wollei]|uniref:Uncharacterized protein n=1 Tax=Microseira wollei NIES-4236 TaxID=2530354 RepID=A0AAV3XA22_9CYAN|nr:hypothetical protein [Microseira wollei]GET36940.1 hypothetical protein MiSe_16930 [Microseira wollei NIES-4236]